MMLFVGVSVYFLFSLPECLFLVGHCVFCIHHVLSIENLQCRVHNGCPKNIYELPDSLGLNLFLNIGMVVLTCSIVAGNGGNTCAELGAWFSINSSCSGDHWLLFFSRPEGLKKCFTERSLGSKEVPKALPCLSSALGKINHIFYRRVM